MPTFIGTGQLHWPDEKAIAARKLEVLQPQAEALHKIAHLIGLQAGDDVTGAVERVQELLAQLAEATKASEFNFEQYQDAGRLLHEECEKTNRILAALKELIARTENICDLSYGDAVDAAYENARAVVAITEGKPADYPNGHPVEHCLHTHTVPMTTGDGTPVEFCPACGRNEVAGSAPCDDGGSRAGYEEV